MLRRGDGWKIASAGLLAVSGALGGCALPPGGEPPGCDPVGDNSTIDPILLDLGEVGVSCNNNDDQDSDIDVFAATQPDPTKGITFDCAQTEGTGAVISGIDRLPPGGTTLIPQLSNQPACGAGSEFTLSQGAGTFYVTILHPASSQEATITMTSFTPPPPP